MIWYDMLRLSIKELLLEEKPTFSEHFFKSLTEIYKKLVYMHYDESSDEVYFRITGNHECECIQTDLIEVKNLSMCVCVTCGFIEYLQHYNDNRILHNKYGPAIIKDDVHEYYVNGVECKKEDAVHEYENSILVLKEVIPSFDIAEIQLIREIIPYL